jgi:hypothetical protein
VDRQGPQRPHVPVIRPAAHRPYLLSPSIPATALPGILPLHVGVDRRPESHELSRKGQTTG